MTRSWSAAVAAACIAGALLCACGHGDSRQPSLEPRAVKNPSDFPLYPRSQVVDVVDVDSAQMVAAMRANGAHAEIPDNYRGHVIIAETSASLPQLRSWVTALQAAPPHGFHDATTHRTHAVRTHPSSGQVRFDVNGDGSAQFATADTARWVYLFTADPHQIHQALGPMFALIDAYSAAPGFLRTPIDDEAKKQTGYTVTQMLDVKSPAGAVIAELKRLQAVDRRAILLIDETKAQ